MDDSYRAFTRQLPSRLRAAAGSLPHRLGLCRSQDGGWGEFVSLHPNRALPLYAAQAPGVGREPEQLQLGLCLPPERLYLFLGAHHLGACHWLVRDRLRDQQVAGDDTLTELSALLGRRWRQALIEATGDEVEVDSLIEDATWRWEAGTRLEQQRLGAGAVHPSGYEALVRLKLAWIAVPSRALLTTTAPRVPIKNDRMASFLRSHDLFLLALQVIDDVIDGREDRALRGSDVATALGCSPGALLRVAPKLADRAAAVAGAAGFSWWSSWLGAFRDAIARWRFAGDFVDDELASIGMAGAMEQGLEAQASAEIGTAPSS
jgi:hypothetical protein